MPDVFEMTPGEADPDDNEQLQPHGNGESVTGTPLDEHEQSVAEHLTAPDHSHLHPHSAPSTTETATPTAEHEQDAAVHDAEQLFELVMMQLGTM